MAAASTSHFNYIIGVDWGSSSFRAYLLGENGEMLDSISDQVGIIHNAIIDHGHYLNDVLQDWVIKYSVRVIIMTGMIGSNAGLVEVPYQTTPVALATLAKHVHIAMQYDDLQYIIIPGVSHHHGDNYDLMRGEETQVLGACAQQHIEEGVFCLPGTHSKWVQVVDSQISKFSTFITGELMYILSEHSILASQISEQLDDPAAFMEGLELSMQQPNILNSLFQVRVKYLLKNLKKNQSWDFFRGLCIGTEFMSAKAYYDTTKSVYMIGSKSLVSHYNVAAEFFGLDATICQSDVVTSYGLWLVAQQYLNSSNN